MTAQGPGGAGRPDQRTDRWSSLPASPAAGPETQDQVSGPLVPTTLGSRPRPSRARPHPGLSPPPAQPPPAPAHLPPAALAPRPWDLAPASRRQVLPPPPRQLGGPSVGGRGLALPPLPRDLYPPRPPSPAPCSPSSGAPALPRLHPPPPLLRRLPPPPTTRGSGIPGGTYSPGRPCPRRAKAREVCCAGAVAPRGKWLVAVVAVSRPSWGVFTCTRVSASHCVYTPVYNFLCTHPQ